MNSVHDTTEFRLSVKRHRQPGTFIQTFAPGKGEYHAEADAFATDTAVVILWSDDVFWRKHDSRTR
ncbi:hypothetical protein KCP78_03225 [Salmonella enterica subsp. enterica]|nr:hypothetical protein KCP78_03225 [Salmonella enterica subsp. enterica]